MFLLQSTTCFVLKGVFSRATSSISPFSLRMKPVASTIADLFEIVLTSVLLSFSFRDADKSRISDQIRFKFNDWVGLCGIPPLPVAIKLLSVLLEHPVAICCDESDNFTGNSTKPELGSILILLICTVPLTPN